MAAASAIESKLRQSDRQDSASANATAMEYAVRIVHQVCCLAGSASLIDDLQSDLEGVDLRAIIGSGDNVALYDWLIDAVSYQGISDRVAFDYMERHGRLTWQDVEAGLANRALCPKLQSYWQFHDCRYDKASRTCAEPDHIARCALPRRKLRNGRLNQTAYSLFLFIRDIADGDLIGWIDYRLTVSAGFPGDRASQVRAASIEPLREVYGVSDKVLMMALSCILISAPPDRQHWIEAGMTMIAVDTLVHNFLHRSGILHRLKADHAYGYACYQPNGCADIIYRVSKQIDARSFNSSFPRLFPRFVQHAIWQYCSQQGLNVCNGNRIDDRKCCDNIYCRVFKLCDRISLE
jgi:hypothetical protein